MKEEELNQQIQSRHKIRSRCRVSVYVGVKLVKRNSTEMVEAAFDGEISSEGVDRKGLRH